jgi:hypothetical protein
MSHVGTLVWFESMHAMNTATANLELQGHHLSPLPVYLTSIQVGMKAISALQLHLLLLVLQAVEGQSPSPSARVAHLPGSTVQQAALHGSWPVEPVHVGGPRSNPGRSVEHATVAS